MIATLVLAALSVVPQEFTALPLDAALQRAVANSPDVAQARERVAENNALLAAARGQAAPALLVNYAQAPQGGTNNNTVIQRLTTVGGQVVLGDYFANASAIRQASFTLASAQFDLLDAQRAERITLLGQYYATLKAIATVGLREQDYAGAESDLRAAQIRYRAGDAPRLDVVRAQVALANADSNLAFARVDLANATSALAIETGEPPSVFSQLGATAPAPAPPAEPERAVSRALTQRSDLFAAQQAVLAQEAAVRVAGRGSLPALTVNAGYTTGVDSGVTVNGPSANVTMSLPISHVAQDRTAAERARLAQAQDQVAAIRRRIIVEVGAAARTYAESVRALASATRARSAAQEELRATLTGYRSGASSSLDVADARRTYVQAALSELSAIYAKAQAAATLVQEMGP